MPKKVVDLSPRRRDKKTSKANSMVNKGKWKTAFFINYNVFVIYGLGWISVEKAGCRSKKSNRSWKGNEHLRTYGVRVITLDFESNNPSSNLGMSSFLSTFLPGSFFCQCPSSNIDLLSFAFHPYIFYLHQFSKYLIS